MYSKEKWTEFEVKEHFVKVGLTVYTRCTPMGPKSAFTIWELGIYICLI